MGVFIIVKLADFKLDRRRKIIYGTFCICLIILAVMYLNINSRAENIEVHNDMLTAQNTEVSTSEKKQGKLIYSVDNDVVLKNPFSFAHETEAEMVAHKNLQAQVIEQSNMSEQNTIPLAQIDSKIPVQEKPEQAKNLPEFRLEAILNFNDTRIALIKLDELSYKVKRGDILAGFNVLEIGKKNVLLLSDNGDLIKCDLAGF